MEKEKRIYNILVASILFVYGVGIPWIVRRMLKKKAALQDPDLRRQIVRDIMIPLTGTLFVSFAFLWIGERMIKDVSKEESYPWKFVTAVEASFSLAVSLILFSLSMAILCYIFHLENQVFPSNDLEQQQQQQQQQQQ